MLFAGICLGAAVSLAEKLALERMHNAFRDAAKLSRRIHRQKEVIKTLKAQLPKRTRQQAQSEVVTH